MIYTLTLNPALDYTVFAEGLTVGAVNRAGGFSISYGGKGINVSAMLKNLNVSSVALGFIAGFTGNELEKLLLNEGINFDFIKLKSGITRINVKIREKSETDINVQGPCASADELNLLYKKLNKLEHGDWLVLSGSIPSGMPSDIYARLSEFAEKRGARVIIDAVGSALTDSLYTKPFLIKPNREELGDIFGEEISGISDAFFYAEKLKAALPPQIRVEYLHGKMKANQKEEIMARFAARETDVLVSTTVIEVGVNVPNATVMMVENADRFGLAQLHQLRGRVGRGKYQSYCIFVSGSDTAKAKDRLGILNQTNDGFKIAEEDLKQRGPGDFFGVRQSGDLRFKIGDIFSDSKVLKEAADAAGAVLAKDELLLSEENVYLKTKVEEYTKECLENINL